MKLPFVSRKKYDIARENYKIAMKGQSEIRKNYIACQEEKGQLLDTNREIGNRMTFMGEEIKDLKKETKYLKYLLTKNGISYKKKEK